MKTVEEFIREIESSEALKDELKMVNDKEAVSVFLKKYDVNATAEEFGEAYISFSEGEIEDEDAAAAAGGAPTGVSNPGSYGSSESRSIKMIKPCRCGYFGDYVLMGNAYRCPKCFAWSGCSEMEIHPLA